MSRTLAYERPSVLETDAPTEGAASVCSWAGLCATSFFLAEVNGVTMPFVNTYLLDQGWGYDGIGAVTALAGLFSFLMNLPGGFLIDLARRRRLMLAAVSLLVGGSFGLLPLVPSTGVWVGILLVAAALGKPLFGPLTNALTLGLVGHGRLDRAIGINRGWNHAGNIAAALTAMVLVSGLPVASVFFAVTAASAMAAGSVFLIRPKELDDRRATGLTGLPPRPLVRFGDLIRDKRVAVLLAAAALFHLANAPVMPLVAQKVKHVGGSNGQVAAVVLVAQSVMIPVAVLAGLWGQRFGHKRVLAVGFAVLPLRIALYAIADRAGSLVALQALDGIGAGIFDVTAIAICADVTRGRGRFNAVVGALGTAVGLGGVIGPLTAGLIVKHLGFAAAFGTFAVIAAAAAVLFIGWMPGTPSVPAAVGADTLAQPCIVMDAE